LLLSVLNSFELQVIKFPSREKGLVWDNEIFVIYFYTFGKISKDYTLIGRGPRIKAKVVDQQRRGKLCNNSNCISGNNATKCDNNNDAV